MGWVSLCGMPRRLICWLLNWKWCIIDFVGGIFITCSVWNHGWPGSYCGRGGCKTIKCIFTFGKWYYHIRTLLSTWTILLWKHLLLWIKHYFNHFFHFYINFTEILYKFQYLCFYCLGLWWFMTTNLHVKIPLFEL